MRISRILCAVSLVLVIPAATGCPAPPRGCAGCTYKTATFTTVPTGTVESASVKAMVKHVGSCPQGSFPADCTEILSYDVKCKLGTKSTITLPMLIDAASDNTNRSARLSVKLVGSPTPTVINGTVETGPGSSSLPATPCAPPTIDPYTTLPDVQ